MQTCIIVIVGIWNKHTSAHADSRVTQQVAGGDASKPLPASTIVPQVTAGDFTLAFGKVQPSVTERDLARYRGLQKQLRSYGAHITQQSK